MMAPSIVLHRDLPALVVGSGGSNRIRSAIVQAILHATIHDQPLDAAANAPRMHIEGNKLWFERAGLPQASAAALLQRFPDAAVFEDKNMFFGGVHCVGHNDAGGDRRRGGVVVRV
jgi:gamma-glutamyltranspeptidase / glutathione hydrolase